MAAKHAQETQRVRFESTDNDRTTVRMILKLIKLSDVRTDGQSEGNVLAV